MDISSGSKSKGVSEAKFLSQYDINSFDRPSVAADIAAFSVYSGERDCYRKNPELKLSLLLIKRGEHPYKGGWALPGGFIRRGETVTECAFREIAEETGLTPTALLPVDVFSEPGRDPRGWIISNAFASVMSGERIKAMGGDDAEDAKWFDVSFDLTGRRYTLTLTNGDIRLCAVLAEKRIRFGRTDFDIIDDGGLAFDHAKIIASALTVLRHEAENFDVIFDFLPEKFTLTALQNVQETLMGITHLPANFRRKAAQYVEETDEITEGDGHRPAKLYRRKQINI